MWVKYFIFKISIKILNQNINENIYIYNLSYKKNNIKRMKEKINNIIKFFRMYKGKFNYNIIDNNKEEKWKIIVIENVNWKNLGINWI